MVGRPPPRFNPYEVNVWVKEGKNGQLVKFSKKELNLVWTPGIACCRDTPLAANKNMKQQQQMQHSLQRCNTGCSNNESRDVALVAQSGYRLHSLVTEIQKWGLKPTLAAETELWEGDRDTLWGRYTALAEHIEHWLITACRDAVLAARSSTGCSDPALARYTALIKMKHRLETQHTT